MAIWTKAVGRVDDRDGDGGLELGAQLDELLGGEIRRQRPRRRRRSRRRSGRTGMARCRFETTMTVDSKKTLSFQKGFSELPLGRSILECFNSFNKGQTKLSFLRLGNDRLLIHRSSHRRGKTPTFAYILIPREKSSDSQSSLHPTSLVLLSSELLSS